MKKNTIIIISVVAIIIFVVLLLFVILPLAGVPVIPGTEDLYNGGDGGTVFGSWEGILLFIGTRIKYQKYSKSQYFSSEYILPPLSIY